jgi:hypothetical protein
MENLKFVLDNKVTPSKPLPDGSGFAFLGEKKLFRMTNKIWFNHLAFRYKNDPKLFTREEYYFSAVFVIGDPEKDKYEICFGNKELQTANHKVGMEVVVGIDEAIKRTNSLNKEHNISVPTPKFKLVKSLKDIKNDPRIKEVYTQENRWFITCRLEYHWENEFRICHSEDNIKGLINAVNNHLTKR